VVAYSRAGQKEYVYRQGRNLDGMNGGRQGEIMEKMENEGTCALDEQVYKERCKVGD